MDRWVWQKAIDYISREDSEAITIGGGEPTLHPDFFEILRSCVMSFDYIWMATNGSRAKSMWRLSDILDGEEDYEKMGEDGIYLTTADQLSVALSLDYFHDPIDPKIETFWKDRSKFSHGRFQIRDVTESTYGPIAVGRAKRTGSGWATGCACPGLMINPLGKIKPCGCPNSPVVGDVWYGIEDKWKTFLSSDKYQDSECFNGTPVREHI